LILGLFLTRVAQVLGCKEVYRVFEAKDIHQQDVQPCGSGRIISARVVRLLRPVKISTLTRYR
jgi:hypothetical protein